MTGDREQRLAAWLDGAMAPGDAAAFEAELAQNPELASRAEAWRANDAAIRQAFAPLAKDPIDPALLHGLGLSRPAANDNAPWWRRRRRMLGGGLAASLVAVLLYAMPSRDEVDALSLALETTPSLQQVRLADGQVIEPVLTVRAADGRWCREYRGGGAIALACRTDGRWSPVATARAGGPDRGGGEYATAGGEGAALDTAYRAIGASDPVAAGQEADLIAGGWAAD